MEKCYIAGKIGDLPIDEYEKLFKEGCQQAYELGYHPISPVDLPHNHDKTWKSYMIEDIRCLMGCEAVYALRNWIHSPGARIEIGLAVQLGIKVIYQP